MGTLVAKLLLPTLSSLALLPAVSVAAKRRFHMEAMVYLFTMFFVALYHACNGPGLSILCFLRLDVLEYFSVYGTALSMWVSLMALADFDEPKRSTFVMLGVLTIAVRTYHDRWGYGVYSGPIGAAVLIIAAKWLQQMKEKRRLYPDKSVYAQQVGPGLCFGALALLLRFFFQDWEYTYVHSFYHCALAMSFVLLLPKVPAGKKRTFSRGPRSGPKRRSLQPASVLPTPLPRGCSPAVAPPAPWSPCSHTISFLLETGITSPDLCPQALSGPGPAGLLRPRPRPACPLAVHPAGSLNQTISIHCLPKLSHSSFHLILQTSQGK
nr:protein myomaker isoform X1 [Camelus dromedarius]